MDQLAKKVSKVPTDSRVPLAKVATKVCAERQGQKGHKVFKESRVHPAQPVQVATKDPQDPAEHRVP